MFFRIIEKGYKKSSHKVCIFCAETVNDCFGKENVRQLLNIFFYVEDPRKFQADSVMIMFDPAPTWVPKQSFLICFLSLF